MVLKPNRGMGSLAVAIISNEIEIDAYFEKYNSVRDNFRQFMRDEIASDGRVVAEQFIGGTLCSVEIAAAVDGYKFLAISRRKRQSVRDVNELGSTLPGISDPQAIKNIQRYSEQILSAIGLDRGLFHIEMILDEQNRPTLVEVNPRMMGGTVPRLYEYGTGQNVYELLIKVHLGLPIGSPPVFKRAVASRVIGAISRSTVRGDLPTNWMDEFLPDIIFHDMALYAGQQLNPAENNFSTYGYFVVSAPTGQQADDKAENVLGRIEAKLQVDLCR